MAFIRVLGILSVSLCFVHGRRLPGHRHEAYDLKHVRQAEPLSISATLTPPEVLTIITPSPGASPVEVTKQSQIVTSYIPEFTLCDLPPIAFNHVSRPTTIASTAPFQNYSTSIPPSNGTCTTVYKTTATMVCATTLSDLTTTYPVTKCPQEITFFTQYGYVLATPTASANLTGNSTAGPYGNSTASITAAPSIRTLTTYFIAPWQELTTEGPPQDVDLKVCATLANGTENCMREYQRWKTSLLTLTTTSTASINFTTEIPGPSQLIVETIVANLTNIMTLYSMSTTMEKEYVTETDTTMSADRSTSTGPTVIQTRTVEEATPSFTSTITRHITSTIRGTTTITVSTPYAELPEPSILPAPAEPDVPEIPAPTSTSYANFASMLGADQYRQ